MTIQLSIELNQLALLTAGAVRCVSVDSIEQPCRCADYCSTVVVTIYWLLTAGLVTVVLLSDKFKR